jgi:type II pantothenate kinase
MNAFVALAKEKGMADLASTVCATGGGAYKFEPDFKREVNMNLNKFDELDSLIRGVEFMDDSNDHELFYYDNPQVSERFFIGY